MSAEEVKSVHFIGIGGTAMASVAVLCRDRGYTVTGSDENVYPPMSTFLAQRGIQSATGYRAANLDHRPDLVVVGNAMRRGNPEVERLLNERWTFCSLPELVREVLLRGHHVIVAAGTHGKTTTAALLAWVLESAGLGPGFLIGGIPNNFGCGARAGRTPPHPNPLPRRGEGTDGKTASPLEGSRVRRDAEGSWAAKAGPAQAGTGEGWERPPLFVIEGDEYDTAFFDKRSKFVHYQPDTVILNNIEYDHADIFPDLAAVKRAFRQLLAVVPGRGLVIAHGQDANVREVLAGACCRVKYFTAADAAGFALPLPGEHNRRNAAAVAVCAAELGLTRGQIQQGFNTFAGVKRRLEVRGEAAGVAVLDDFAHHPTALAETIRAIREKYPRQKVWALFEPRSNTTRRNVFQRELAEALAEADGVYISKVDRLDELPATERLRPELIVATVRARGKPAAYCAGADEIVAALVPQLSAGDVVAVFSNGKFDSIHDKLLARLRAGAAP